jgi:peptidoglycan/xylan/chitin deacetylase (PgdA/CDA1 family)
MDVLDKHGIKATVAMDALTAENYPYLVRHCQSRGCEVIGHGISLSQMITSKMSEQEEREYIRASVEALRRATGTAPLGWLGPEYGESARTPQLLAQEGIHYVCDWTNDEQPYPLKASQGELFALPIMLELDDINALWDRRVTIDRYGELLKESFDTIYRDGSQNGRLLVLNLHPWLIGQPFRIGYLDDALGYIMRRQGVWAATGSQIVDWYRRNPPVA